MAHKMSFQCCKDLLKKKLECFNILLKVCMLDKKLFVIFYITNYIIKMLVGEEKKIN